MSTPQTFDLQQTVCVNPATGDIVGYSHMNTAEEARDAVRRARADEFIPHLSDAISVR